MTAIETRLAGVITNVVLPVTEPEVAVIVVFPVPVLVAKPNVGEESLMVATFNAEEVQYAELVKSCVVLSLNVPVAANCWPVPRAMDGLAGVMMIEIKVAELTVNEVEPEIEPELAVIVVVPAAIAVARPVALIVATLVRAEVHVTVLVKFCVDRSV